MKKIVLICAIIGATLCLAVPAEAKQHRAFVGANCATSSSPVYLDGWGYVSVDVYIKNCTAPVTKVMFMWGGSQVSGFWDKSECGPCVWGNLHYYQTSQPGVPLTVNNVVPGGVYGVTFHTFGWCSPGGVHQIFHDFWFKIYNSTGAGSWGQPANTMFAATTTHCGS